MAVLENFANVFEIAINLIASIRNEITLEEEGNDSSIVAVRT